MYIFLFGIIALVNGLSNSSLPEQSALECRLTSGLSGSCLDMDRCSPEVEEDDSQFPVYCNLRDDRTGVCCQKEKEINSTMEEESGLECQLDSQHVGSCYDWNYCPEGKNEFLSDFPVYCALKDGKQGVCCHKDGEEERSSIEWEITALDCQLELGLFGTCNDKASCPVEEDVMLSAFPKFCRLRDGRKGVCCHKEEGSAVPMMSESCIFNSTITTATCQYIGDCPSLRHITRIDDYVFCNLERGVICCPEGGGSLLPKEQKEGDICILPNGDKGTCSNSYNCPYDPYKPYGSNEFTYCNEQERLICCKSNTVPVPPVFQLGDYCNIYDGRSGTCMSIHDCPENSNILPNSNYCGEGPLVCCLSTQVSVSPIPQPGDDCSISDGRRGVCMSFLNCLEAVNTVALSNSDYCHEENLLVCCPLAQETKTNVMVPQPTVNFECGNSYPEPIGPGYGDVLRTLPIKYMALIGLQVEGNAVNWICNGVLINERWVLTSAHCFLISASGYSSADFPEARDPVWAYLIIRLGEHDYNDDRDLASFVDIGVERVSSYPDYVEHEGYHDLALIKLVKDAPLGRYINPVCLPWSLNSQQNLEGYHVLLTGWGASDKNGDTLSFLHSVSLTIFSFWKCHQIYSQQPDYWKTFPNGIGSDTLCAGDPYAHEMACHGNYGAPLVYLDYTQRYVLAGVEFQSYGCNAYNDPGLFVNIQLTPYLSWIKSVAFFDQFSVIS